MSAQGRPKRELLPLGGMARSAKGAPISAQGRPKREYRSAQHEGSPVRAQGRPKRELRPLGECGGRHERALE
jgi:16S rRNA (guanine527-N7)-methyltransferase